MVVGKICIHYNRDGVYAMLGTMAMIVGVARNLVEIGSVIGGTTVMV